MWLWAFYDEWVLVSTSIWTLFVLEQLGNDENEGLFGLVNCSTTVFNLSVFVAMIIIVTKQPPLMTFLVYCHQRKKGRKKKKYLKERTAQRRFDSQQMSFPFECPHINCQVQTTKDTKQSEWLCKIFLLFYFYFGGGLLILVVETTKAQKKRKRKRVGGDSIPDFSILTTSLDTPFPELH